MKRFGIIGVLLVVACVTVSAGGEVVRHAGRVQSVIPADGILVIEEVGADGVSEQIEVRIRRAEVVRLWRDPAEPWRWRERPTSIYRWPVGTFVVIIGRAAESGLVEASRVEIPKIAPEQQLTPAPERRR